MPCGVIDGGDNTTVWHLKTVEDLVVHVKTHHKHANSTSYAYVPKVTPIVGPYTSTPRIPFTSMLRVLSGAGFQVAGGRFTRARSLPKADDLVIEWLMPDMCLSGTGMYPESTHSIIIPGRFQMMFVTWYGTEKHLSSEKIPLREKRHPLRVIMAERHRLNDESNLWNLKHLIAWCLNDTAMSKPSGCGHWILIQADPAQRSFTIYDSMRVNSIDARLPSLLQMLGMFYDLAQMRPTKAWSSKAGCAMQQTDDSACGWATVMHMKIIYLLESRDERQHMTQYTGSAFAVSDFAGELLEDLFSDYDVFAMAT